jgi:O-antigen/teichoic acid export membrane protein
MVTGLCDLDLTPNTTKQSFRVRLKAFRKRLHLREFLRAGHATLLKIITTLLTLAFGVIGARLLGVEVFGAYVSLFAVAGLLSVATSAGLPQLLAREFAASRGSRDRSNLKPLAQALMALNLLLLVALLVSIIWGAWIVSAALLFCLLVNISGSLEALFLASERVLLASWIVGVVRPIAALLALLVLCLVTAPSNLLPLAAQTIGVVAALAALLFLWRGEPLVHCVRAFHVPWWSRRHPSIMKAGLILAATQLLINLTTQLDILILTAMASPEDVAHYYAAVRAALVVNFFFGACGLLAEPTLTRLYAAKERGELQVLATRTAFTGAVVTLIAGGFAVLLAPWYLGLYGPSFAVAYPSFCIFVAGIVVRSFFGPSAPLLRAIRAERSLMNVTGGVLVLNAIVSVALVPWLGMEGAAIGSAIQFVVYGLLLSRAVFRNGGYRSSIFLRRPASII